MPTTIAPRIDLGVDQWVVLPATWEIYTGLSAARGEKSRPRYIFVDGRLTVVSPGCPHESVKTRIGGMIEEMLTSLRIPFTGLGSVTLLTARFPRTGVEADETYFLSDIARVHRKRDLVVGEDPAPTWWFKSSSLTRRTTRSRPTAGLVSKRSGLSQRRGSNSSWPPRKARSPRPLLVDCYRS